jgi:predicted nuclease of predicted toxin-antitoxin system
MRLLLDQGLPRSTVLYLRNYGIEAVHVGDPRASDCKGLEDS